MQRKGRRKTAASGKSLTERKYVEQGLAESAQRYRDLPENSGTGLDITERKRAEGALRESETRFRSLFENSLTGISMAEPGGRLIRANLAYAQIYGYGSAAEMMAEVPNVAPLYANPEDRKDVLRIVAEKGTMEPREMEVVRRDGTRLLVLVTARGIRDATGNLLFYQAEHVDITERKRAEDALRASEERYRGLFESSRDAIMTLEPPAWKFTSGNPATLKMFGANSEEEITTLGPGDLSPERQPDGRASAEKARGMIETAMREGSCIFDWTHRRTSGEDFAATVLLSRMQSAGKVFLQATVRDISETRQAGDALRFQAMLLESQNQASIDGILIVDPNGKILWFNRQFLKMWGVPPDTAASGSDNAAIEFVVGQVADPDAFMSQVRALYLDRDAKSRDEIHLKDGRVFDRYSAPVVSEENAYLARVWLFRDVTEKTRMLASLAQSDRLAAMGMLAAGVAHEINNPLTYVLYNLESVSQELPRLASAMRRDCSEPTAGGGSESVARQVGDHDEIFTPAMVDDMSDRLRDALAGTERIKEIARGLGTFSRVEQTRTGPVDVRRAAEHAIGIARNEIRYRARLVRDFHEVPAVLASDGKLAQVFLNLLVNAAFAIAEGDVEGNEIRVRTWAEHDQVFVEVKDTGAGIAPQHRSRIFEPFFTTKGVGVGSGPGLSICKNIVTSFGGEISFESEVGKGTRFLVCLPAMPDDGKPKRDARPAGVPVGPHTRGRILVVDDVAEIRTTLTRLLGGEHEVVAVSSGEEGQTILEGDQAFDVLFFDLMMPRMSGMDLHEWLARRDPGLAGRVVFITGGAFTPKASEYLAKVRNPQVAKPFDARALKDMVNELVQAAKTKR